jgi:hypothetical protein
MYYFYSKCKQKVNYFFYILTNEGLREEPVWSVPENRLLQRDPPISFGIPVLHIRISSDTIPDFVILLLLSFCHFTPFQLGLFTLRFGLVSKNTLHLEIGF